MGHKIETGGVIAESPKLWPLTQMYAQSGTS